MTCAQVTLGALSGNVDSTVAKLRRNVFGVRLVPKNRARVRNRRIGA
jgi:hypothetical protein